MERVAILSAVDREIAPLARRIHASGALPAPLSRRPGYTGRVAGVQVLALAGGMGHAAAARTAQALIAAWVPDLIVVAGVAGALCPQLQVGDLVAANRVVTETGLLAPPLVPPPDLVPGCPCRTGTLLSIDRVLNTAEEKRRAAEEAGGALAVEMETAAAAAVAEARGIPWAALRAVSDTASESLPLDFNALRDADGDLPTLRVALAAVARPASIPGLIRLGRNTTLAAEALALYLEAWLGAL